MIKFTENDLFLVTGASSGIGKSIVLKINKLGGKVIGVARNRERLDSIKNLLTHPANYYTEVKNLTEDMGNLDKWVMEISIKYGKLKGLVLSAGNQQILPMNALDLEQAKEIFDINYFCNIMLAKGFCDRRINIGEGSSIIFISSVASITGNAGIINYSASKGAINSAVRSMAIEVAKQKIRVNSILPGLVKTELFEKWKEFYTKEYIEQMNKKYPLGIGSPEYISDMCCFLISENAKWITGQCFVVDGGISLTVG